MLKIQNTTRRNGVFYCQFWSDGKLHRTSLKTDSGRQAQQVMKHLYPFVDAVRTGKLDKSGFDVVARSVIETKETGNVPVTPLESKKKNGFMTEDFYSEILQLVQNADPKLLQLVQSGNQDAMQHLVAEVVHGRTQKQFDSINGRLGYDAVTQIAGATKVVDKTGTVHLFMDSDPASTEATNNKPQPNKFQCYAVTQTAK